MFQAEHQQLRHPQFRLRSVQFEIDVGILEVFSLQNDGGQGFKDFSVSPKLLEILAAIGIYPAIQFHIADAGISIQSVDIIVESKAFLAIHVHRFETEIITLWFQQKAHAVQVCFLSGEGIVFAADADVIGHTLGIDHGISV